MEYEITPQLEEGAFRIIPRLQIGSHTTPAMHLRSDTMSSSCTSSMYMLTITLSSAKLCEQLAEVVQLGQGKYGRTEERDNGGIPSDSRPGMWSSMKVGTDRLSREIGVTPKLPQRFPVRAP